VAQTGQNKPQFLMRSRAIRSTKIRLKRPTISMSFQFTKLGIGIWLNKLEWRR
jgi:hypothetical protein